MKKDRGRGVGPKKQKKKLTWWLVSKGASRGTPYPYRRAKLFLA